MNIKELTKLIESKQKEARSLQEKVFRELLSEIRKNCEHDFNEWSMSPNPEFRINFRGEPMYSRRCKVCGEEENHTGKLTN